MITSTPLNSTNYLNGSEQQNKEANQHTMIAKVAHSSDESKRNISMTNIINDNLIKHGLHILNHFNIRIVFHFLGYVG